MLRRIYADNYRCLVNFEVRPEQTNLLVGDNGSGKTCLFEVLEAIQDIVVLGDAVQDTIPTSTLTRWDTRDIQASPVSPTRRTIPTPSRLDGLSR